MRLDAVHSLDIAAASELARRIQQGPTKHRDTAWRFDAQGACDDLSWDGIGNKIRAGDFACNPAEVLRMPGKRGEIGLLGLCAAWLDYCPIRGTREDPRHPGVLREGVEKVFMALVEQGYQPVNDHEAQRILDIALLAGAAPICQVMLDTRPQASAQAKRWLREHNHYMRDPERTGAQLLATRGHGELLAVILERGLLSSTYQDEEGNTLAHLATQPNLIHILAAHGFDAEKRNQQGLLAPQHWVQETVDSRSIAMLREAWFEHFPQAGGISHAHIARQSIATRLLDASPDTICLDMAIVAQDGLVDGRSLMEWSTDQSKGSTPSWRLFHPPNDRVAVRTVFNHSNPKRILSTGASEGLHFATAHFQADSAWAYFQEEAYQSCPERKQSPQRQRTTLHAIAKAQADASGAPIAQIYEGIYRRWWQVQGQCNREKQNTVAMLAYLETPDPLDAAKRNELERDETMTELLGYFDKPRQGSAEGWQAMVLEHAFASPRAQSWMRFALASVANANHGMAGDDPGNHFLPSGAQRDICVRMLAGFFERDAYPTVPTLSHLGREHRQNLERQHPRLWSMLQGRARAHEQADTLETTTPTPLRVPRKRRL